MNTAVLVLQPDVCRFLHWHNTATQSLLPMECQQQTGGVSSEQRWQFSLPLTAGEIGVSGYDSGGDPGDSG